MMLLVIFYMLGVFQLSLANIYNECVEKNHISLTFDDGPLENTINIVDTLDKWNISGAFFINGLNIQKGNYYNFVKKLYNSHHVLGTHTFSHPAMELLNRFNQERELYDNEFIFRQLFNIRPYFVRFPYFSYNDEIIEMCRHFGYEIVDTYLDTDDWKLSTGEEIYQSFISKFNTYNGHIVLMHDYHIGAVDALNKIITYVISQNYTFVSLDKCLGVNKKYNIDNMYGPNLNNGFPTF